MNIKVTPKMMADELEILSKKEIKNTTLYLSTTQLKKLKKYIKAELIKRELAYQEYINK